MSDEEDFYYDEDEGFGESDNIDDSDEDVEDELGVQCFFKK